MPVCLVGAISPSHKGLTSVAYVLPWQAWPFWIDRIAVTVSAIVSKACYLVILTTIGFSPSVSRPLKTLLLPGTVVPKAPLSSYSSRGATWIDREDTIRLQYTNLWIEYNKDTIHEYMETWIGHNEDTVHESMYKIHYGYNTLIYG